MRRSVLAFGMGAALLVSACTGGGRVGGSAGPTVPAAIHKIKHVIVIMQENRSFDSYFGTYPGADGIPMNNGAPAVCITGGPRKACVRPYVDHADVNGGGPHGLPNADADIGGG